MNPFTTKATTLGLIEEIRQALLRVPALTASYEKREARFIYDFKTWLHETEGILEKHRLSQTAQLSTLRGILLAMERGVLDGQYSFTSRNVTKKHILSAAAYTLNQAQQILSNIIQPEEEKLHEANLMARQVLAIAWQQGAFSTGAFVNMSQDLTAPQIPQAIEIWKILEQSEGLRGGLAQMLALLGAREAQEVLLETFLAWKRQMDEDHFSS